MFLKRVEIKHNHLFLVSIQAFLDTRDGVMSNFIFNINESEKGFVRSTGVNYNLRNSIPLVTDTSSELTREIGKVGMKIYSSTQSYSGIEFFDRENNSIYKCEWNVGKWEYQ